MKSLFVTIAMMFVSLSASGECKSFPPNKNDVTTVSLRYGNLLFDLPKGFEILVDPKVVFVGRLNENEEDDVIQIGHKSDKLFSSIEELLQSKDLILKSDILCDGYQIRQFENLSFGKKKRWTLVSDHTNYALLISAKENLYKQVFLYY